VAELAELRAAYEREERCALWFPIVRVCDVHELGAFSWKPAYRLVPAPGRPAVCILPGHLGILEPRALRLPLLYRLLNITYATRNRSIAYRRTRMLATVGRSLLAADLGRLARLRAPLTWTVVTSGLRLAARLRAGTLQISELERLVGQIILRSKAAAGPAPYTVRYPVVEMLSLAEDIDTEEEAHAAACDLQG
jgi:hypothetical protein